MYDPKAIDPKTVRDRYIALLKLYGITGAEEAKQLKEFDDPTGPDWAYDMTSEGRATRAARTLRGSLMQRGQAGRINQEAGRELSDGGQQGYLGFQLLGERPIRIQLTGPDGLEQPHEPAAADLNEAAAPTGR